MRSLSALIIMLAFSLPAGAFIGSGAQGPGRFVHNPLRPPGMYVNLMKSCNGPLSNVPFPGELNVSGYPTVSPPSLFSCLIPLIDEWTANSTPGYVGAYKLFWRGNAGNRGVSMHGQGGSGTNWNNVASISVSGGGTCSYFSNNNFLDLIGEGPDGCTITFTPPNSTTRGFLKLCFNSVRGQCDGTTAATMSGYGGITQLDLYRADHQALYDAGKIYNPDYLDYLKALNPRVLRFLQWQSIVNGNLARFEHQIPFNAMTWTLDNWVPNKWVGSRGSPGCTTADGINYVASAPPGWEGKVDGSTIHCQVNANNINATPTLNVAGTGSAPIVQNFATNAANKYVANRSYTFTYITKLNRWQGSPAGAETAFAGGLHVAQPFRAIVGLCNELSDRAGHPVGCWLQIPAMYNLASARQLATEVATYLKPSNEAYFEYNNECFSFFTITAQYCRYMGEQMGLPASGGSADRAQYTYHGLRSKQMFDTMRSVWPAGASAFNGVLTTQLGSVAGLTGSANRFRFKGEDLTFSAIDGEANTATYCSGSGCSIVADYRSAPNRPIDAAQVISIGTYTGNPNMIQSASAGFRETDTQCLNLFGETGRCPFTTFDPLPAGTEATVTSVSGSTVSLTATASLTWTNGTRVFFTGTMGLGDLDNGSTTASGWTNTGSCGTGCFSYSFTLSNTADAVGNPISSSGYGGFSCADTCKARRLLPGTISLIEGNRVEITSPTALSWAAGDRIYLNGDMNLGPLDNGWTTIVEWTSLGADSFGIYTYRFSLSNTTDDFGSQIANDGYTGYACTPVIIAGALVPCVAKRVQPGLNDALLNAASLWAQGDNAGFRWGQTDFRSGSRVNANNGNPQPPGAGNNPTADDYMVWATHLSNIAVDYANAGTPKSIMFYEGAYASIKLNTHNGLTLGWSLATTQQVQQFIIAFRKSDHLAREYQDWLNRLVALPYMKYPAQFMDIGEDYPWRLTPTLNFRKYEGENSWGWFRSLQNFSAGRQ